MRNRRFRIVKNLLFLFLLITNLSFSQVISITEERELKALGELVLRGKTEMERDSANALFAQQLTDLLKREGSFDYRFDSVLSLGKIYSPDSKFRTLNWNMRLDDGTYQFSGIIQTRDKFIELDDKTKEIKNAEGASLNAKKWYGAQYYQIVKAGKKRKPYYLLLGWKGNDRSTTKKVIEVLRFDSKGEPVFGENVFSMPGKKDPKRLIFEYAADVSMSLRYQEESKMIVFDHLSPRSSDLKGQYQFYGPDLSYDALKLKKGKWVLKEDIDARNEDRPADKQYKAPK